MPLSTTSSTALPSLRRAVSSMRPPSGVYLAALFNRLPTTWTMRAGSACSSRSSSGRCTTSSWCAVSIAGRAVSTARSSSGAQAHRLALQLDQSAVDARQVQQVVDEAGHLAHLPVDHLLGADLRRRLGREPQHGHRVLDRGERIAQLVRERGEELVLAPVLLAQHGAVAHAFDVGPAAFDDVVHQRHLVRRSSCAASPGARPSSRTAGHP